MIPLGIDGTDSFSGDKRPQKSRIWAPQIMPNIGVSRPTAATLDSKQTSTDSSSENLFGEPPWSSALGIKFRCTM